MSGLNFFITSCVLSVVSMFPFPEPDISSALPLALPDEPPEPSSDTSK